MSKWGNLYIRIMVAAHEFPDKSGRAILIDSGMPLNFLNLEMRSDERRE